MKNPQNLAIGNYLSLGFTQRLVVSGFGICLVVLVLLGFGIFKNYGWDQW
ncbi:MAG: hypothetical protein H8D26_04545 [Methanomicrobia archaeon]|nr:hypothetical protein [Methanomicrobia archaeon]